MAHDRRDDRQQPALAAALAILLILGGSSAVAQEPEAPQEPSEAVSTMAEDLPPIPAPPRFVSGLSRTFSDVFGDLFFWGQGATLDGPIGYNAVLGGSSVFVTDDTRVGGDLVAFAGDVGIDGEVMQNAYLWAGTVRIGENAVIHGNVMCFCGTLRVEGTVRGQVLGGGGNTAITGDVGSVKIEAGIVTVGPEAIIRGDLEYESNDEADISDSATIMGEVHRTIQSDDDEKGTEEEGSSAFSAWSIGWRLWRYLSSLLVGVVLLLVGGRLARLPASRLRETPAAGLGFGFVVAVVTPVACLISIPLIVSIPLGLIGLVLFGLAVALSSLVTSQFLGDWLLRRLSGRAPSEYAALALGLLLLSLVGLIPYVGFLIRLTAILLGLGGMFLALRPVRSGGAGASPPMSGQA
jgi:cytoskeletal protein CcmA (bactofilin family)